jgi:hypothetical protein
MLARWLPCWFPSVLAAVLFLGHLGGSPRGAEAADVPPGTMTVTVHFSTGAPDPNPDFPYVNGSFISHHPGDAQGRFTFTGGITAFQHGTTFSDFGPYDGEHGCLAPRTAPPGTASFIDLTLTPILQNPLSPALNHTDQFGAFLVSLRDTAGNPVPLTTLTIRSGPLSLGTGVDEHGQVRLPAPAGVPFTFCGAIQRRLDVAVPDVCSQPVAVAAGQTHQVDLVGEDLSISAPRGQIVGGVYLAGTKVPLPGAMIKLEPTPDGRYLLGDDRYQFLTVSATFTVRVIPPDGYAVVGPDARQVAVPPGGSVEADFFVRPISCRFVLGFQMLHDAIPAVVGDCADDEQHAANGEGLQQTTKGLLVWRKADNFTAFTDGYRSWVNGPNGLQQRLNARRFAWEANPGGLPVVP